MVNSNIGQLSFVCRAFILAILAIWSSFVWGQTERQALIDGAKKEGEVVFYTGMSVAEVNVMKAKFEEKYPFVQVRLNRIGGDRITAKVFTEASAGKNLMDVVSTSEFDSHAFNKRKILARYLSPEEALYPKEYKDQGFWTGFQLSLIVTGFNTKMVTPQNRPKTYEDLLIPAWKSKIMLDPTKTEWFAGMLEIMGKEKGLKHMRDLSRQDIVLRQGNALRAQLVTAGEVAFDVNMPTHTIDQMKQSGAPIDWVALGPVPARMNTIGIAAKAPHPFAARLFLDFWLSKEGQRLVRGFNRVITRSDLATEQSPSLRGLRIVPVDPGLGEQLDHYEKLLRDIFVRGEK